MLQTVRWSFVVLLIGGKAPLHERFLENLVSLTISQATVNRD